MKGSFNLSDWALKHQSFVWYLMFVALLMGVFSYMNLGREEDPSFTIKTMVVQAQWPGASPEEMARQVTDRIEKKLQNESFVSKAPEAVVNAEREKADKARALIAKLEESAAAMRD